MYGGILKPAEMQHRGMYVGSMLLCCAVLCCSLGRYGMSNPSSRLYLGLVEANFQAPREGQLLPKGSHRRTVPPPCVSTEGDTATEQVPFRKRRCGPGWVLLFPRLIIYISTHVLLPFACMILIIIIIITYRHTYYSPPPKKKNLGTYICILQLRGRHLDIHPLPSHRPQRPDRSRTGGKNIR